MCATALLRFVFLDGIAFFVKLAHCLNVVLESTGDMDCGGEGDQESGGVYDVSGPDDELCVQGISAWLHQLTVAAVGGGLFTRYAD